MVKRSLIFLLSSLFSWAVTAKEIAFFYQTHPPVHTFPLYSSVVVQPYSDVDPKQFQQPSFTLYAYASLGEVSEASPLMKSIPAAWIKGRNASWGSAVMDAANPAWQTFFIDQIIAPLVSKGYQGVFLDTLDSYELFAKTPAEKAAQLKGVYTMIAAIHARFPTLHILVNRGFDIIPDIKPFISGVVAESLFKTCNPTTHAYGDVSQQEHHALLEKLKAVSALGVRVIVIDYVPEGATAAAHEDAKKITALGLIPWVTNQAVTADSMGTFTILPRKILVLYDEKNTHDPYGEASSAFTEVAFPLQYLGYVPIFQNVNTPLPSHLLPRDYAGILFFHMEKSPGNTFDQWVLAEKKSGIPILFLGGLPFDESGNLEKAFGFSREEVKPGVTKVVVSAESKEAGYEVKVRPTLLLPSETMHSPKKIIIQIQTNNHQTCNVAGLTHWGGYVFSGFDVWNNAQKESYWQINPFALFQSVFGDQGMPIPDVTTENGDRLMMVHVDGDGFLNRPYSDIPLPHALDRVVYAADVIQQDIFLKYRIPTSVSIIQGEMGPTGIAPNLSPELEKIARDIFSDPFVEMASHTYSHPFNWQKMNNKEINDSGVEYNLPIKDYQFNLNTEIVGSMAYINQTLAPKDKKAAMIFWSGSANPTEAALKIAYENHFLNVNGGSTDISHAFPAIQHISANGIYKGHYFQVYAPIANEMVYTHNWSGPYYGFQNVIQTLEMTDKPMRFKPIDIYYHFYSGERIASLNALKKIYDWSLSHTVMNVYESDYVKKMLDSNNMVIAKESPSHWLIAHNGNLRELRVSKDDGYPDLDKSSGVIGYSEYDHMRYIHLAPGDASSIYFMTKPQAIPSIQRLNTSVLTWHRDVLNKTDTFSVDAVLPIKMTIANLDNCHLTDNQKTVVGVPMGGVTQFNISEVGKHTFEIICP